MALRSKHWPSMSDISEANSEEEAALDRAASELRAAASRDGQATEHLSGVPDAGPRPSDTLPVSEQSCTSESPPAASTAANLPIQQLGSTQAIEQQLSMQGSSALPDVPLQTQPSRQASTALPPKSQSAPPVTPELLPQLSSAHMIQHRYSGKDGLVGHQVHKPRRQAKPVQYLERDDLWARVSPTHAQLALCSAMAYENDLTHSLEKLSKWTGIPTGGLQVYCQSEDSRVGLGLTTLISPFQTVGEGKQVAAAIFAFRGTVISKRSNVAADLDVWRNANRDLYFAARALKHVSLQMAHLREQYPHVQWGFFATGHSLGGFTASCCAIFFPELLHVVAFESPGLTSFYHKLAAATARGEQHRYWQERCVNFLTWPNPINCCQKHLGSMYRVQDVKKDSANRRAQALHAVRCIAGSTLQIINCILVAKLSVRLLGRALPRVGWLGRLASKPALRMSQQDRDVLGAGIAVRPAARLGASALLRNSGAYMAARLGTTAHEIVQQHGINTMLQMFDPETGHPRKCVKMASWPRARKVRRTLPGVLWSTFVESLLPIKSAAGIRVIFDKEAMVEARMKRLPGYVEETDKVPRRQRLAQHLPRWASGVLQVRPQRKYSSEQDDDETDTEDADSASESGDLCMPEPRSPPALIWGAKLSSPFAEAAHVPVDEDDSSQVAQLQRSCRRDLKRALTAAAMHHDSAMVERFEKQLQQGEQKLERLLTMQHSTAAPLASQPSTAQQAPRPPRPRGRLPHGAAIVRPGTAGRGRMSRVAFAPEDTSGAATGYASGGSPPSQGSPPDEQGTSTSPSRQPSIPQHSGEVIAHISPRVRFAPSPPRSEPSIASMVSSVDGSIDVLSVDSARDVGSTHGSIDVLDSIDSMIAETVASQDSAHLPAAEAAAAPADASPDAQAESSSMGIEIQPGPAQHGVPSTPADVQRMQDTTQMHSPFTPFGLQTATETANMGGGGLAPAAAMASEASASNSSVSASEEGNGDEQLLLSGNVFGDAGRRRHHHRRRSPDRAHRLRMFKKRAAGAAGAHDKSASAPDRSFTV